MTLGEVYEVWFCLRQLFFQCSKTSCFSCFRGLLQHCFAVKLINCFVDYANDSSRVLGKVILQNVSLTLFWPIILLHVITHLSCLQRPPPKPLKLLFYNDSTVNKAPAVFLWNHWLYSFWWWEMSSCSQVLTCVSAFYWNNTWISTLSTEGKTRDKKILVAWRRKRFAFYEQKKMAALGGRGSHYSKTCSGKKNRNWNEATELTHSFHGLSLSTWQVWTECLQKAAASQRAPTFHLI